MIFTALFILSFVIGLVNEFSYLTVTVMLIIGVRVLSLKNHSLVIVTLLISLFLYVRTSHFHPEGSSLSLPDNQPVLVQAKETTVRIDGDKVSFEGLVYQDEISEKVMVTYYIKEESEKEKLIENPVRAVAIWGKLSSPGEPSNFHQFNYKNYLKSKRIFSVLTADDLRVLEDNAIRRPYRYFPDSLRQNILTHVDHTMNEQSAAYTKTLLFADKRSFSNETTQTFRELGLLHLLSISGLHVVMVISLLQSSLIRLKVSKETTSDFLMLFLPFYGLTTGLGISVFRAIGQTWIKLAGEKLTVTVTTLDSWSVMLIVTVFLQPYSVTAVGFQLSYLISFIIIMVTNQDYFRPWSKIKQYLGLNLIVLITSVPILTYHFYEFSWGVLALNSLFIPFIAVVLLPLLILNLFLSILMPGSFFLAVSLLITDKVIFVMETFASTIASNISFTFISGRLALVSYVLMTCLILVLLLFIEKNSIKIRIALPLTGIFLCLISVRYSPYGQVLMIDVGQGEAILIREPWGRGNYLIDTGGEHAFNVDDWRARSRKFSVGENIMVPVLKAEGVHELESIIITHPDIDHYGSLIDIISEIKTRQVVSAEATYFQTNFQLLFPSIAKYGTIIKVAAEGSNTGLPANTFALLSRSRSANMSKNNSSLVFYGWIGDRTWLFTGDLEIDGEKELLEKYPGLTADVLKVGHHGSQTSTHDAFLDQLDPHVAWISCGKANRFGHPHDDVIDKLIRQDTVLYRTDSQGAVRYRYRKKFLKDKVESQMFSFEQKRERRGE